MATDDRDEIRDFHVDSPGNLMDSKTSHLDDLLSEKLDDAFHSHTAEIVLHQVAKIASEHSPIDLAYAAARLPLDERGILYDSLGNLEAKAEFLITSDSSTKSAILWRMSDDELKKILELMPLDEAIDLLEVLSDRRARRLLEVLDQSKAEKIREILTHNTHTASRMMSDDFFAFDRDSTIGEVAEKMRERPGVKITSHIFVLDEEGKISGYVLSRNLIVNPSDCPLRRIMKPILHKVHLDTTRDEVVDLVERYKIPALPVEDDSEHLCGVITYDDVVEAIEDIADETIAHMAGTGEKVSEPEPMMRRLLSRSPWLFVTLVAGLVNMGVMSSFQNIVGTTFTFVLFFVPLITGLSGGISMQCSTVLVRGMAIGMVSSRNRFVTAFKEVMLGFSIGALYGAIAGLLVYFFDFLGISGQQISPLLVGLIVGIGLFGACLSGTFLGVISPLFFARIGVDPAIASGPIITSLNDFLSMSIYFLIAMGLTSLLL